MNVCALCNFMIGLTLTNAEETEGEMGIWVKKKTWKCKRQWKYCCITSHVCNITSGEPLFESKFHSVSEREIYLLLQFFIFKRIHILHVNPVLKMPAQSLTLVILVGFDFGKSIVYWSACDVLNVIYFFSRFWSAVVKRVQLLLMLLLLRLRTYYVPRRDPLQPTTCQ